MSVMEYLLCGTEKLHGSVRRYTSPDEHPFFPEELTPIILPEIQYPKILPDSTRKTVLNHEILEYYVQKIIPGEISRLQCVSWTAVEITQEGDDGNHGSAALADVHCLQVLSKRIHLGKFVAEVKFRFVPEQNTMDVNLFQV